MGLMIMPIICVAQNNDGLPCVIYFIPMRNQISQTIFFAVSVWVDSLCSEEYDLLCKNNVLCGL